jgi:hypothetical protein
MHTQADFDRMAQRYQTPPWSGGWDQLINNPKVKLTYLSAPLSIVYRGSDVTQNFGRLVNECIAMYGMALRWKITGDTAYAAKATEMLNGWTSTLTSIQGVDRALVAGPQGFEIAQIAEILRGYSGFTAANFTALKDMLRNIFYPISHELLTTRGGVDVLHINANWELYNMAGIIATGVLCDDQAMFDEAVTYFKAGVGNGAIKHAAYYMHPGYLCQWQESGRDQIHAVDGIEAMAAVCEVAWHQGVDLYSYDNNRCLAAAEYSAKANLIQSGATYYTVPYVPYKNDFYTWNTFSTLQQGVVFPCWGLLYNHYVNRMGLSAPYLRKKTASMQPGGAWDELIGYDNLCYSLDPVSGGAAPSGLSAYISAGSVVLSWWGGASDIDYAVMRAPQAGGPYTTVASGISDLRSYTDTPPAPGRWYYIVTANTPVGVSAPSNEVSILTGVQLHTRLRFDEAGGTNADDTSGNGHAGTLVGAAGAAAGKYNNALLLNGSTAYVSLPDQLMDDVGDFTIATWVNWKAARTWERLFAFGGGTDRYLTLAPRSGSGKPRLSMSVNGRFGERNIDSSVAFPTGRWVHVAVTLSGRVGTIYIDGVAVGTNTDLFLAPFRLWDTNQNWIGRSHFSTEPYFNGMIDDFRIYRGALSADDVAALMNDQARYLDLTASVQLTQQGAVFNRATQKYVGGVTLKNTGGPLLTGPLMLKLRNLTAGITLDNAGGIDNGDVYVSVNASLAPGAVLDVPLTFTNPARSLVAYTPLLLQRAI